VVTIVLKPLSPDYKRWHDLVLLTLCRYALDDQVLSDVVDPSIYWARLDSIVVTWILGTLSPELHEIVREPTGSRSRLNSSATVSCVFYNSMPGSAPSNRVISASVTTVVG
jgi:hypothetical protein